MLIKSVDHDFQPKEKLTPFGIFLPAFDEVHIYLGKPPVTIDFIVDCLKDFWKSQHTRFSEVKTLLINQDNGPIP